MLAVLRGFSQARIEALTFVRLQNIYSVHASHKACRNDGLMMFKDVIAAFYDTDTKCVNRDGNILGRLMLKCPI
jgi:hypothetical protein